MLDSFEDVLLPEVWHHVAEDAVVVVDGILLLQPALAAHWDYFIWIDVDIETTIARACQRDASWVGSTEAVERRYRQFRQPLSEYYERIANPADRAHAVVDNRDLARPHLVRLTRP